MQLVSLNIGRAAPLAHEGAVVMSAIAKTPVTEPLRLGLRGLPGDEQADKRHHGGPDQAVCVYPSEHYAYWLERLGKPLSPGAFGENFTTEGLLEHDVVIGDVYLVGGATVRVSSPRQPCYKLGARHGEAQLPLWAKQSGFTGFYLEVLEPGEVAPGDVIHRLERPEGVTVAELNRLVYRDHGDLGGARRALDTTALPPSWRALLRRRLER